MSPGRTSQPAESNDALTPAAIDAPMPSEPLPSLPTSGRTTMSRAATLAAREIDERGGGDDDRAQVAGDRACQRLSQHAGRAQRLRQLVAAGAETFASPGGQDDDGSL